MHGPAGGLALGGGVQVEGVGPDVLEPSSCRVCSRFRMGQGPVCVRMQAVNMCVPLQGG